MNSYEILLDEARNIGLVVKEKPLQSGDGRIKGNKIAIRHDIKTSRQKANVLAEELGHYYTSTGDIRDQSKLENRKQERQARLHGIFATASNVVENSKVFRPILAVASAASHPA